MSNSEIEQIRQGAEEKLREELKSNPNFTSELSIKTNTDPIEIILKDEILPPSKIVVKPSTLHGYGVFAAEDILKEEIIEECAYADIGFRHRDRVSTELRHTFYLLPCNCEECNWRGKYFVASSGYLQLYNCSKTGEEADIELNWIIQERLVQVRSLKNIKKGKEILIWYGDDYGPLESMPS